MGRETSIDVDNLAAEKLSTHPEADNLTGEIVNTLCLYPYVVSRFTHGHTYTHDNSKYDKMLGMVEGRVHLFY